MSRSLGIWVAIRARRIPINANRTHTSTQIIMNVMPGGGDTAATASQATASATMSSAPIKRPRDCDLKVRFPCTSDFSAIVASPGSHFTSNAAG
jgi:hypothetical protein